jgi:tetratricopeptide (TPR) repeat protein
LTINVKDGDRRLANYDIQRDQLLKEKKYVDAANILDEAQKCYQVALRIDPLDIESLMGTAKVERRRAELAKEQARDPSDHWKAALKSLDTITERDKQAARAYYNKACYKNLMGQPATDTLKDLQSAIDVSPALKERAKTDPDLQTLKDNTDFKKLVGLT